MARFSPQFKTNLLLFFFIFIFSTPRISFAQQPATSGEIYMALEKFGVLANVLYLAAHPDDENTRMISYLSNDLKANTRYLSLTRGDGGQNLIGPEIKELLGVIRTQELLAARSIDGGSQTFSRANDFGYSKNAEETIEIWDDEQVLSDVVWAIRKFRPDVIINRFDHRTSGRTHGHHTASAILSYNSWEISGDKNQFKDQLQYVEPWKPSRIFMNTSWWFYGSRENFDKADKTKLMSVDIGAYYPLLGKSNNEIAAESRSMHKCQGMGSTPSRGSELEYFEIVRGDMPATKASLLEGINTTWTRVNGGEAILKLWQDVLNDFSFIHPENSIPQLLEIRKSIVQLKDKHWKNQKLKELDDIILSCAGIYLETVANTNAAIPGESIDLETEMIKRLNSKVGIVSFKVSPMIVDTTLKLDLATNEAMILDHTVAIPQSAEVTTPYWLQEKGSLGMYKVEDRKDIGKPESDPLLTAHFTLNLYGEEITYSKPVTYKFTHSERGEVHEPLEILDPAYVSMSNEVYIFEPEVTKEVTVVVKAMKDNLSGNVSLDLPDTWKLSPASQEVAIKLKGGEQLFTFQVTAPETEEVTNVTPVVTANGKSYSKALHTIDYQHIPLQRVALPAQAKLVNLMIEKIGNKIAYIEGAGDAVPESLREIGYSITVLSPDQISADALSKYDAVVMGIRAYNKWEELKFRFDELMTYVENGGTLITQYTVNRRLQIENIGPYPLNLSRDRVSVEEEEVRILAKEHPVMNYPNKITSKDFEGWVQERGLYFADEWDEKYTPILSSNDPNEPPRDGGFLVAEYGKGYFVYSGYSWFRQLPAGVPGAFRIFANMIALGNQSRP